MTTSNVLATIAFVVALTGSGIAAYAAVTLTGANVKNLSLTTNDVSKLSTSDFASATQTVLKAQVGDPGAKGSTGDVGPAGFKGNKGPKGPDAARSYSYITADDTNIRLQPKDTNMVNPPNSPSMYCGNTTPQASLTARYGFQASCLPTKPYYPHWAYDCGSLPSFYCGLNSSTGQAGQGTTPLVTSPTDVISFVGDENGSFVSTMGPGNIIVTGTVTLLKQQAGQHTRVACQAQVRRSDSNDSFTPLGVPTTVSADDAWEIVHVSVTGGTHLPSAGDYDYQIACWLLDRDSAASLSHDFEFVSGNATATTTEL